MSIAEHHALDTTTFHNEVWRTFQPIGAKVMTHNHETPDGYTVFHWPEFQALAKRLMIDMEDPIVRVIINVGIKDLVHVTTETLGQDSTKKK